MKCLMRTGLSPSAKIAEAPMKNEKGQDTVEEMTITLSSRGKPGDLEIVWGASRLAATFSVAE